MSHSKKRIQKIFLTVFVFSLIGTGILLPSQRIPASYAKTPKASKATIVTPQPPKTKSPTPEAAPTADAQIVYGDCNSDGLANLLQDAFLLANTIKADPDHYLTREKATAKGINFDNSDVEKTKCVAAGNIDVLDGNDVVALFNHMLVGAKVPIIYKANKEKITPDYSSICTP